MPLVPALRPFRTTIFAEMSALAARTGAINLGQGFPDTDGPAGMLEAAQQAIRDGRNQYPPGLGILELRQAIALARERDRGQLFDPETEVLVTVGATEAVAAAVLALVTTGDEVVMLEPHYDSYPAVVALSGATHVSVALRVDNGRFALDLGDLAAAITPATRMILLNTPYNPTGTVLTAAELDGIAELAIAHDLIVVADEVYEYLTFDGIAHIPIGSLPGMAERTITVSSSGKTFSATGWKIGWACGPQPLIAAVRAAKQFLTYVGGAPFQPAIAYALRQEMPWVELMRASLEQKRDLLSVGLVAAGFTVHQPQGAYFIVADIRELAGAMGREPDGMAFCLDLPDLASVVAIPQQVFYDNPADGKPFVRFAFCKQDQTIRAAAANLATMRR